MLQVAIVALGPVEVQSNPRRCLAFSAPVDWLHREALCLGPTVLCPIDDVLGVQGDITELLGADKVQLANHDADLLLQKVIAELEGDDFREMHDLRKPILRQRRLLRRVGAALEVEVEVTLPPVVGQVPHHEVADLDRSRGEAHVGAAHPDQVGPSNARWATWPACEDPGPIVTAQAAAFEDAEPQEVQERPVDPIVSGQQHQHLCTEMPQDRQSSDHRTDDHQFLSPLQRSHDVTHTEAREIEQAAFIVL
mmetsp:Transcript_128307/g.273573  ORF Transcript_128307/g.273573 Transcript_128307/m.273573 type:complete len:251 (+) Transcript_128307:804-1556(+)